jgi:V/A-type H+-transporting ATPase subunit D
VAKIKLNKNSLRDQRQSLRLYQEFLPTLELRKQQLQAELRTVQQRIDARRLELDKMLDGAVGMAPMLETTLPTVKSLVAVDEVKTRIGNVAGVRVPVFEHVKFKAIPYSLVGTPPFFDAAIELWQKALGSRAEIAVLAQQMAALALQLTKTTQRINLYEKVLIPECKENIRKIKVYLGDQQTAGVCRAKIAKGKLVRYAEAEAHEAGGAP